MSGFRVERARQVNTLAKIWRHDVTEGEGMAELDRTVWTAPVRNLVWVAAHFGHR
jgi:hypothetical protein